MKEGFLIKDHSGDVLTEAFGGNQQAALGAPVLLVVFQANGLEALADRAGEFIRR